MNTYGIDMQKLEVFGEKYCKEVKILLQKLGESKNGNREKCLLFKAFATKFTLLPKLWNHWQFLEKGTNLNEATEFQLFNSPINCDAEKHFYSNLTPKPVMDIGGEAWGRNPGFGTTTTDILEISKEGLFFPHHGIDKLFDLYNRKSSSPLTQTEKGKCEKMLQLYKKLVKARKDSKLWTMLLAEYEDHEYIVKSCEYRLVLDPYDDIFWDAYLYYLKTSTDSKLLLQTYSRYCKLFLFNWFIQDEFFDAISSSTISNKLPFWEDYIVLCHYINGGCAAKEKMTSILKMHYGMPESWNFAGEYFEDNLKIFMEYIQSKEPSVIMAKKPANSQNNVVKTSGISKLKIPIPKTFSSARRQYFPFHAPTIRYLLDKASPLILQKLQMSCKELYYKKCLTYCHRLLIKPVPKPTFHENFLVISVADFERLNLKNFHLGNSLEIHQPLQISKTLIPKIRKCSLRFLALSNQTITESELNLFTAELEMVEFCQVLVKNSKSDPTMPLDQLLQAFSHIPRIILLDLPKDSFSAKTLQNLSRLERSRLLTEFSSNQLPENLNIDLFAKFVEKNAAAKATLKFRYDKSIERIHRFNLETQLKNKLGSMFSTQ